jgi:hypothetical protein
MNEITKELLDALKGCERIMSCFEMDGFETKAARAAIAKAEAALAEPQADADGWIPWSGGECPVSPTMLVEVKLRSGKAWLNKKAEEGSFWEWYHGPKKSPDDIIAYRPLKI